MKVKLKDEPLRIGAAIKELRKRKKMSQGELADAIGTSQTSLSQIEGNVTYPHTKTIQKIAAFFEMPEQFIYLLSITENDVPEKNKEIYKIVYPSVKQMLYSIIDSDTPVQ